MTYDVVYRSADVSRKPRLRVGAVAFPWMGESSGAGLAPWRLTRLRVQATEQWPYGDGARVISRILEDVGRRVTPPMHALEWFPIAPDGSSGTYPLLVSIAGSGATAFSGEQCAALRAEVAGVAEHMVGLDRANFAALLFVLDEALADGSGEIEFLAG